MSRSMLGAARPITLTLWPSRSNPWGRRQSFPFQRFIERYSVRGPAGKLDTTQSGRDFHLALSMIRAGQDDRSIADAIRRRTKKRESHIDHTIQSARRVHEETAPVMRVAEARLDHLPARFGRPEMTRVSLTLVDAGENHAGGTLLDGVPGHPVQPTVASITVPTPDYANSVETWNACFPDIPPGSLTGRSWGPITRAWEAIRWKGRTFEVAVRDGTVRWIRAAPLRVRRLLAGSKRRGVHDEHDAESTESVGAGAYFVHVLSPAGVHRGLHNVDAARSDPYPCAAAHEWR